jgi:hypothetical protein
MSLLKHFSGMKLTSTRKNPAEDPDGNLLDRMTECSGGGMSVDYSKKDAVSNFRTYKDGMVKPYTLFGWPIANLIRKTRLGRFFD